MQMKCVTQTCMIISDDDNDDDMLLNYLILVLSYAMHDITDSQCDIMLS
jgi:hypothetical protein